MTTDPPRCPKCGEVPTVRRASGTASDLRLTHECRHCGEKYIIPAERLSWDEEVDDRPDAA